MIAANLGFLILLALPSVADSPPGVPESRVPVPDAVRRVVEEYSKAWLAGDADAVMRLFTPDAVLLPHHGDPPVIGESAIRRFWWPPNTPKTEILEFENTIEQAREEGTTAWAWGRFKLRFRVAGESKSFENAGTYLMLLRRGDDGRWRITHRMWDDPPPRVS